jgi:hypothetical protein
LASIPDEQRSVGGVNLTNDFDALESNLVSFISKHSPESIFEKSFYLNEDSQFDFYNWGGLRYFLMCYEEKIQLYKTINIDTITKSRSEGKSGDYLSVEHIWAIENRNGRDENSRKIDFHEKRRLGNFVLLELRLNIKGGNKDIEEKLAIYLSGIDEETPTVLKQVILLNNSFKFVQSDLFSLEKNNEYFYDLHRLINDEQEKRYTNFAMERWSIRDYLGYSVPTDNILLEGNA